MRKFFCIEKAQSVISSEVISSVILSVVAEGAEQVIGNGQILKKSHPIHCTRISRGSKRSDCICRTDGTSS